MELLAFPQPMIGSCARLQESKRVRSATTTKISLTRVRVVIGVSQDSNEKLRSFAQNHQLPFLLISDKEGVVAHAFNSQFQMKKHVDEALSVLTA